MREYMVHGGAFKSFRSWQCPVTQRSGRFGWQIVSFGSSAIHEKDLGYSSVGNTGNSGSWLRNPVYLSHLPILCSRFF
jgi:hypothetical protein